MTSKLLPPPAQSTQQIREYLAAVQKGKNSHFVIQGGRRWFVRNQRDLSMQSFPTKADAITYATTAAAKQRGTIFVFDSKGNLLERQ